MLLCVYRSVRSHVAEGQAARTDCIYRSGGLHVAERQAAPTDCVYRFGGSHVAEGQAAQTDSRPFTCVKLNGWCDAFDFTTIL